VVAAAAHRNPGWSRSVILGALALLLLSLAAADALGAGARPIDSDFPPPLETYNDQHLTNLWEVLRHRVEVQPFNLYATLLFFGAVLHTFFTHKFRHWAHVLEHRRQRQNHGAPDDAGGRRDKSVRAALLHFLGEVEAVFGIWVVPLMVLLAAQVGMDEMFNYVDHRVSYHEPWFVVVIMTIASTRPILRLSEQAMSLFANLGGGRPVAWWFSILTIGPVLGSFITEPAAMTISASLLAKQFYRLQPRLGFAYATLGLLFVNVSVGGTFTHFAAPPVLMVAQSWGWDTPFMARNFGLTAAVGIILSNLIYYVVFRRQFAELAPPPATGPDGTGGENASRPVPVWITVVHLLFMAWSVFNAHHLALLIGGLLFFLAFYQATEHHQSPLELRSPILVGFFLAGLVIHGGLQQWWIAPVLRGLSEVPLFFGATLLTAFNDNAAITYLATLVPGLSDTMKHAVVAGAVTGGGLTVIANAPNPAGQAILNRFFPEGIGPAGLFLGAFVPTAVVAFAFMVVYRLLG
jgi:hypothetical protein